MHTSGVLTNKGCRHESGSCGLALREASLLPEVTLEQAFKCGQKWIRATNAENTETSSYTNTCVLLYFQIISMLLKYPTATKTMWTPSCGTRAAGDSYYIYIISSPAHDKYWQSWAKQGLKPLNEWTSRTAGWRTPWLFKQAWSEVPGCLMLLCFESAVWSMHISLLPSK